MLPANDRKPPWPCDRRDSGSSRDATCGPSLAAIKAVARALSVTEAERDHLRRLARIVAVPADITRRAASANRRPNAQCCSSTIKD
jgi:hypothetical protein